MSEKNWFIFKGGLLDEKKNYLTQISQTFYADKYMEISRQ